MAHVKYPSYCANNCFFSIADNAMYIIAIKISICHMSFTVIFPIRKASVNGK